MRAVPIHAAVFSGGRGRPPLPDGKNAGMAERSVLKQIKQAVPGFTRDRFCAWYFISSARTPDQCSRRDPPGADLRSAEPGRTAAWRTFWPLDTPVQPRDEDFVLHFLTQSRQGYCVHFASAAAVMLRALDIPARYVSGYVAVVQGGRADVPDSAAHAWVEYYLDGFGWLPLEATPGFARETSVLPEALLSGEGVPENGESNAASRDTASSETEGRKEQGADPAVNGPDRAPLKRKNCGAT